MTYQQSTEALDVAQGQGDVHKHNDIANNNGADVTVALSVYFIFNTTLATKGDSQVGVCVVLHKSDKPEIDTHTQKKKTPSAHVLFKVRAFSDEF